MAAIKRLALTVACLVLAAMPASAAQFRTSAYSQWLQDLQQEAIAEGISQATVEDALGSATLDDRVVTLDQKQPEATATFDSYSSRILSSEKVPTGQTMMEKYAPLLKEVSARYNVQPEIIVALWGMESSYGRHSGDFSVVDSLLTLAYEGRRADFFRKELLNALRILDQSHMASDDLRGSWAGAMGQCQFMPSTYLKYAVDYDGNGTRDIWDSNKDVFASIANYIAAEGWVGSQPWGFEVQSGDAVPAAETGLDHKHNMNEWGQWGVRDIDGNPLPNSPLPASLIQPDGPNGRSFLVYDNFRALMRWNRSTYFATTVGLLADRIK